MMMRLSLLAAFALSAAPALAQHAHGGHAPGHAPGAYAGMQDRAIKALSAQQLADLRAGKGMTLALPAELNGYPGPLHALELAEPLNMSPAQRARTQDLFAQMQREARALGEELIAAETALDALFREKRATADAVAAATAQAAQAQGRLRQTHLRYHLAMMDVLSAEQVAAYNRLRGY
jgi:Spy/CpxP family protein refolding chaperone